MAAHNERNRRLLAPLGLAALAALTVVGCSTPAERPVAAKTTITVTPAAVPTQDAPAPAPTTTVTIAAPAPVTVTVPPAAPPAPPAPQRPVVNQIAGPFQSPSGNIRCTMFTSAEGNDSVNCAAASHDWLAPQPANCGANWGDRIDLEAGSPARFGCYGQDMPPVTHTLQYGQIQTHGSVSCSSETVGMMCIDTNTGHYFRVSRENYALG